MQIHYRTKKLERQCTVAQKARKDFGLDIAEKLQQRIQELSAAESIEQLIANHIGRCHALHGDREGQYAMDLRHPHRLIFIRYIENIRAVEIIEIGNAYH